MGSELEGIPPKELATFVDLFAIELFTSIPEQWWSVRIEFSVQAGFVEDVVVHSADCNEPALRASESLGAVAQSFVDMCGKYGVEPSRVSALYTLGGDGSRHAEFMLN